MALASQILSHKLKIFSKNPKNRFLRFFRLSHICCFFQDQNLISFLKRSSLYVVGASFLQRFQDFQTIFVVLNSKGQLLDSSYSQTATQRSADPSDFSPPKLSDSFIINPLQIWLPVSDGT